MTARSQTAPTVDETAATRLPQFGALSLQKHDEKGSAQKRGNDTDGDFGRGEDRASSGVAQDKESGTQKEGCGNQDAMVGSGDQADRMGHDQAHEPDGAAERGDGAGQYGTHEVGNILQAADVDAARGRPVLAAGKRIQLRSHPNQGRDAADDKRRGPQ